MIPREFCMSSENLILLTLSMIKHPLLWQRWVVTTGPTSSNVKLTSHYPRVIIDCFFHIPFRNFCLKAFVFFKVLSFEWNAPFTPFNPWIETVLYADVPREAIADRTALCKSATSSNWRPRRIFFSVGNKKKSQGPNQGCKEDDQALQWTVCRSFPES